MSEHACENAPKVLRNLQKISNRRFIRECLVVENIYSEVGRN